MRRTIRLLFRLIFRRTNRRAILRGLGLVVAFAILWVLWLSRDLPTPSRLARRPQIESTKFYDRNGNQLFENFGTGRRTRIKKEEMPLTLRQATIAIEDKNFYKHHGVDFRGILRALVYNIIRRDSLQGGSTITQQYIKNAVLGPKRTLARKIKEVILALELEQLYSKDDILSFYLNEVAYGNGNYGIEAASQMYFGKSAKDLNLQQSALLASIPVRPTFYSPYGPHREELLARKDFVLRRMSEQGFTTETEFETAKRAPITFEPRRFAITAPHFVLWVKDQLVERYGEKLVNETGLKVTTSLDLAFQKLAEEILRRHTPRLNQTGASNAALVALDPKTGEILAMAGSLDYFDPSIDGNVNVTLANRQPGSAIKPITYATAFKRTDLNPARVLFDVPTDFGGGYQPENYDTLNRGPITIRSALANSINVPAVKAMALAGVENVIRTAEDLGITTFKDRSRFGLSLTLGGGEVKPLELAAAYAAFSNGGKRVTPVSILKIEDATGRILDETRAEDIRLKPVLDPQVAYLITSILADTGARAPVFGNALTVPGRIVAAKTGTTQEYRDAWTAGYAPNLAAVVWAGNNDNRPVERGGAGAMLAAPIWREFMTQALKDRPVEHFLRPDGIVDLAVDRLSNKLPTDDTPPSEIITDIFASWQIPTEKDDIHLRIRVNKDNGKLASARTPPDLVEERYIARIRSERPDTPSWEEPVQAWALAAGLLTNRPTEVDDTVYEDRPQVTIESPKAGEVVKGRSEIRVSTVSRRSVEFIECFVDELSVGQDREAPFSCSVDWGTYSQGDHAVSVVALDGGNQTGTSRITLKVE